MSAPTFAVYAIKDDGRRTLFKQCLTRLQAAVVVAALAHIHCLSVVEEMGAVADDQAPRGAE